MRIIKHCRGTGSGSSNPYQYYFESPETPTLVNANAATYSVMIGDNFGMDALTDGSFVFGNSNTLTNDLYTFLTGLNTTIDSSSEVFVATISSSLSAVDNSSLVGRNLTISNVTNVGAFGEAITMSVGGNYGYAFGYNHTVNQANAMNIGYNLVSDNPYEIRIGYSNLNSVVIDQNNVRMLMPLLVSDYLQVGGATAIYAGFGGSIEALYIGAALDISLGGSLKLNNSGFTKIYGDGANGIVYSAANGHYFIGALFISNEGLITYSAGSNFKIKANSTYDLIFNAAGSDRITINGTTGNTTIDSALTNNGGMSTRKTSGALAFVGGVLKDFTADVTAGNGAFADLFSYTIPVNTITATGEKIEFKFSTKTKTGETNGDYRVYFAGTKILDTTLGSAYATSEVPTIIEGYIIRTGASTAKAIVRQTMDSAASTGNPMYVEYNELTGLNFAATNIIKLQGKGTVDNVIGKSGTIKWFPAGN